MSGIYLAKTRSEPDREEQRVRDLEVENKGLVEQVRELTKQRNEWQELALSRGYPKSSTKSMGKPAPCVACGQLKCDMRWCK